MKKRQIERNEGGIVKMVYLVAILFILIESVIAPFFVALNYYRLGLFSMIQPLNQHFLLVYRTPQFLQNWLHDQMTILPIFIAFFVLLFLQRSRLSKRARNLSDTHGIRGSARWASRKEILKWWR